VQAAQPSKLVLNKIQLNHACYSKKEDSGLTIVAIHVGDCYVIGSEENMDKLVEQLTEAGLKVKVGHQGLFGM
jgi:CRISPR type IV-associated protein Csf3